MNKTEKSRQKKILRLGSDSERDQFGPYGYGGNNRSRQIEELISKSGLFLVNYNPDGMFSRFDRLHAAAAMYRYPAWRPRANLKQISRLAGEYCGHLQAFRSIGARGITLTENSSNYVWCMAARDAGWSSIILPQCIESLWPNWRSGITGSSLPKSMHEEISFLKTANSVFFISREEQWLAANYLGVKGFYLPYFPPADIRDTLRKDRQMRQCTEKKGRQFLILAAAVQPNTINGLIEQADILLDIGRQIPDLTIHVVGAGTEKLSYLWKHPIFKFHGPTSSEELRVIKANSRACLIYGPRGHGALTRIPEMLLSGIPVIADAMSCRSAWNYSGVHSFDNIYQLKELLMAELSDPLELPPPIEHERQFLSHVESLIRR